METTTANAVAPAFFGFDRCSTAHALIDLTIAAKSRQTSYR